MNSLKTHFISWKERTNDGKDRIKMLKITRDTYINLVKARSIKSPSITLPNTEESNIHYTQIVSLEGINDNEILKESSNFLVYCDDCNGKYTQEDFKNHVRECMEYKYQNWKAIYPEKAKEWEERISKIKTDIDKRKTYDKLVKEIF